MLRLAAPQVAMGSTKAWIGCRRRCKSANRHGLGESMDDLSTKWSNEEVVVCRLSPFVWMDGVLFET